MTEKWIGFSVVALFIGYFIWGVFKRTKVTTKALKPSELERAPKSNYVSGN